MSTPDPSGDCSNTEQSHVKVDAGETPTGGDLPASPRKTSYGTYTWYTVASTCTTGGPQGSSSDHLPPAGTGEPQGCSVEKRDTEVHAPRVWIDTSVLEEDESSGSESEGAGGDNVPADKPPREPDMLHRTPPVYDRDGWRVVQLVSPEPRESEQQQDEEAPSSDSECTEEREQQEGADQEGTQTPPADPYQRLLQIMRGQETPRQEEGELEDTELSDVLYGPLEMKEKTPESDQAGALVCKEAFAIDSQLGGSFLSPSPQGPPEEDAPQPAQDPAEEDPLTPAQDPPEEDSPPPVQDPAEEDRPPPAQGPPEEETPPPAEGPQEEDPPPPAQGPPQEDPPPLAQGTPQEDPPPPAQGPLEGDHPEPVQDSREEDHTPADLLLCTQRPDMQDIFLEDEPAEHMPDSSIKECSGPPEEDSKSLAPTSCINCRKSFHWLRKIVLGCFQGCMRGSTSQRKQVTTTPRLSDHR